MALEHYLMGELPTKQTTIKGHLEGAAPAEAAPDGTKYFDADTGIEWTRFNGAWTRGLGGLSVREIDLSAAITPAHPVVDTTNTTPTITDDTYSITRIDEDVNAVFSFGPEEFTSGRCIWSPHNHSEGGLNAFVIFNHGEEAFTYFYLPGSGLMAAPPAPASPMVVDADFEPGDYMFFAIEDGEAIWGTTNIAPTEWPVSDNVFTIKPIMGVSALGDTVTATMTTLLDVIELPPEVASVLADYPMVGEGAAVELPDDAAVGVFFRVTVGGTLNGITFADPDGNGNADGFVVLSTSPVELLPIKETDISNLVEEAPSDDKQYARKNKAWEEVEDVPEATSSVSGTIKLGDDFKLASGKLEHNSTSITFAGAGTVTPTGQTTLITLTGIGSVNLANPSSTPKEGNVLRVLCMHTGYSTQNFTTGTAYTSIGSLMPFPSLTAEYANKFIIYQWVNDKYYLINSVFSRDTVEAGSTSHIGNNTVSFTGNNNTKVRANYAVNSTSVLVGHNVASYGTGIAIGQNIGSASVGVEEFVGIGYSTSSKYRSVAIGWFAKTGSYGVSIGLSAGAAFTATDNIAIGRKALDSATVSWGNIAGIGYNAQVTGANQLQLGDTNTNVYGENAYNTRSDERDKADIRDTELGLEFVLALTPRQYRLDPRDRYRPEQPEQNLPDYEPEEGLSDEEQKTREAEWTREVYEPAKEAYEADLEEWRTACRLENIVKDGSKKGSRFHNGFVAQEVKEAADSFGKDFAGFQHHQVNGGDDVMSLGYEQFIAPMVKAIQEQQSIIADLTARLEALEQTE